MVTVKSELNVLTDSFTGIQGKPFLPSLMMTYTNDSTRYVTPKLFSSTKNNPEGGWSRTCMYIKTKEFVLDSYIKNSHKDPYDTK